jgi:FtsP/CotA-like multicopper oxidase with cupredoxin domain
MNRNTIMKRLLAPGLVLGSLGLANAPVAAVDYYLCAGAVSKTMPDSVAVPMWGFAQVASGAVQVGCSAGATVPGPKLTVPVGDSLTIHLYNDGLPEPVSLVIPGQAVSDGSSPVFFTDAQGRQRVRSFTHETDPGSAQTYSWSNLGSGTYTYHSGTHPQVQVQMGLYGAVTKDAAAGEAYSGVSYDAERDLFYSEVDPALHAAVDDGSYGTTGPTSTLDYIPKYFLLNGYDSSGNPVDVTIGPSIPPTCIDSGLTQGDRILLRLYNAGLRELTPTMLGAHFDVVAEGGKKYPFAPSQYSVLLQPGSTKDLVFTPSREGRFSVVDRRLNLTDAAATGGGFQTCLLVGGGATPPPTAVGDSYGPIDQGAILNVVAPGVLGNDTLNGATLNTTPVSGPSHAASFNLNADGSFSYTHNGDASTNDSFVYEISNAGGNSQATVTITVNPPVALGKHVGDLDGTAIANTFTWQARVTITVHDQDHNPVEGAIVSRSWTPAGLIGAPTCTTDAAGQCLLSRRFGAAVPNATMTVTDLTGTGGTYQSSANHDPDGDSTGTSITVARP